MFSPFYRISYLFLFFLHFIRKSRPLLTEYFLYFWENFIFFLGKFFFTFYKEMTIYFTEFIFYFWGYFIFFLRKFFNILYITAHLFLRKNGFIYMDFFTVIQTKLNYFYTFHYFHYKFLQKFYHFKRTKTFSPMVRGLLIWSLGREKSPPNFYSLCIYILKSKWLLWM